MNTNVKIKKAHEVQQEICQSSMVNKTSYLSFAFEIQSLYERFFNRIIQNSYLDLRFDQVPVLFAIKRNQTISQQNIAKVLNRDKASITRTIKTLCQKGYVIAHSCHNDNRKNTLQLTPEGLSVTKIYETEIGKMDQHIQTELGKMQNISSEEIFLILDNICTSFDAKLKY